MSDTVIRCPQCGAEIEVSKILEEQIRHDLEARLRLEQAQRMQAELQKLQEDLERRHKEEEQKLRAELDTLHKEAEKARQEELRLLKEKMDLQSRLEAQELELQKRLMQEREKLRQELETHFKQEAELELKAKEEQIRQLQKALEDARQKATQGSQEIQGESLEALLEDKLRHHFPRDHVQAVPKGLGGADLIQEVQDEHGKACGKILWEAKNTKHWQPAWIDKLKQDQAHIGAQFAVIVSVTLPDGVDGFAYRDGVWICGLRHYLPLCMALRQHLLHVAWIKASQAGQGGKMQQLYDYLSGDAFRQRVEAILDAFEAMQAQLGKERKAMQKHWAEREKLLARVIDNTSGMYGDLRGIIGQDLPDIPALDWEGEGALPDGRLQALPETRP